MTTLDRLKNTRQNIKTALVPVNAKLMELTEQKVGLANQLMVVEQLIQQEEIAVAQAEMESEKASADGKTTGPSVPHQPEQPEESNNKSRRR